MNRLRLSTLSLTLAIAVITLGYVNVASAVKPTCPGDHPSCKTDDGATFNVVIAGDDGLAGGSGGNPWVQGFGGNKAIGLNDASPAGFDVGTLTGLSSFTDEPVDSSDCFPSDYVDPHTSAFQLHQALIKPGKKGRAEASFWFHGQTKETMVRVLYVLKLFGEFDSGEEWPGAQTLSMISWELKVENEGKQIKDESCADQGGSKNVTITVSVP